MKIIATTDAVARYDKRTIILQKDTELDVDDAIGKSLVAQKLATPVKAEATPTPKPKTTRRKKADADD
jgi:hypothetical protein